MKSFYLDLIIRQWQHWKEASFFVLSCGFEYLSEIRTEMYVVVIYKQM